MQSGNPLEFSYLEHILIAITAEDRSAPYRTFFDNWFAFKIGGPFLNRNSRPNWHNNPCPDRHGEALKSAHFLSSKAARTLSGVERQRLVKDHAIPVAVLREMLIDQQPSSIAEVEQLMLRYYRIGVITQRENEQLRASGLNSEMPRGWTTGHDPFARYAQVGIISQDINETGWAIRTATGKSLLAEPHRLLGSILWGKNYG